MCEAWPDGGMNAHIHSNSGCCNSVCCFEWVGGNLGEQDWDNTRFSFVVRRLSDSRSGIEFTHHGINDSVGCYSHVNKAWGVIVTKYVLQDPYFRHQLLVILQLILLSALASRLAVSK